MRFRTSFLLALILAGCSRDDSITRGADSAPDWERRLNETVQVGMQTTHARAVLVSNGFRCTQPAAAPATTQCDKEGGARFATMRRHWRATLTDSAGVVVGVSAATEMSNH